MAHKKGAGSSDNGRDSKSKRLGVKLFGGQSASAGNIIIRQRGTKFHAGDNVYMGRDHTLHATIDGLVVFKRGFKDRRFVSVEPYKEVVENPVKPKKIPSNQKQNPAAPATPSVVASGAEDQLTPLTPPPGAEDPIAPLTPPGAEDAIAAPAPKKAAPKKAAAPKAAAPKAEAAPEKAAAVKKEKGPKLNDLKIIEGVGPKIETLLKEGGISTWAELAAASEDRIKEILDAAGPRYQVHDPSTWPAQSKFAAEGKWEELKEYQDMLTGGRDKSE